MKRVLLVIPLLIALSCSRSTYYSFSGYAQGGTWTVKANLDGVASSREEISRSINAILTLVDTTFSGYNANSILSRRNRGLDVPVNREFEELLSTAEAYRESTGGALDVWSAPLYDVWGFGFSSGKMPSPQQVALAMQESRSRKRLNFNAIAQGYTCDLLAAYLRSVGVKDYLVDIGEIACRGVNPQGEGWTVGIDTPEDGNLTPGARMSGIWKSDGRDCGIVTSGNYRKFYIVDGRKYAHTVDPRTGYPVSHNLLSATVVAPTATRADALATYFMVVGFEEARAKVLEDSEVEACLITSEQTWSSPGFYAASAPSADF